LFGSSTPALCEEPVSTLGAPPPRRGHRPLPRRRRRPDGERCRHRLHRHRRRRLLHRRACHASRRGCSRFTGHARRRCSRMPKRELRRASAEACDAGGGGGGGVGAAGGGVVSGGGGGGGVASGVGVALIWAGQRVSSSWLAAAPRARLYHSRLFAHGNTSRVPCEPAARRARSTPRCCGREPTGRRVARYVCRCRVVESAPGRAVGPGVCGVRCAAASEP